MDIWDKIGHCRRTAHRATGPASGDRETEERMMVDRNDEQGRREAFWREHLTRQAQSGLAVGEYCRCNRLAVATYYLWRRRIHSRAIDTHPNTLVPMTESAAFVQVRLPEIQAEPVGMGRIQIELPDGIKVSGDASCDCEHLIRIATALWDRCS
jgi:hypothetical protein